jgi:hypothetical protein
VPAPAWGTDVTAPDPDLLTPSTWTVETARDLVARARHAAGTPREYAAVELFGALCDYADDLYGDERFDFLLDPDERREVAGVIQRILGDEPGSADDGRLDQPVNAPVTLAAGRLLAAELAVTSGWQADLGRALQGVYAYLDELHGGPGEFVVLLALGERAAVAKALSGPVP